MKKYAILLVLGVLFFSVPVFSQAKLDNFWITVGPGGNFGGGGSGYGDATWYLYPSGWINEWFYDHPFDPNRGKTIHIEFDYASPEPGIPTQITVAVNWSTPEWSQLGHGDQLPPVPGYDEQLYINRSTIMQLNGSFPTLQHFVYDFTIWSYNPEWVSIDVRGSNFVVTNGMMLHDCVVGTKNSSWGSIKANFR